MQKCIATAFFRSFKILIGVEAAKKIGLGKKKSTKNNKSLLRYTV